MNSSIRNTLATLVSLDARDGLFIDVASMDDDPNQALMNLSSLVHDVPTDPIEIDVEVTMLHYEWSHGQENVLYPPPHPSESNRWMKYLTKLAGDIPTNQKGYDHCSKQISHTPYKFFPSFAKRTLDASSPWTSVKMETKDRQLHHMHQHSNDHSSFSLMNNDTRKTKTDDIFAHSFFSDEAFDSRDDSNSSHTEERINDHPEFPVARTESPTITSHPQDDPFPITNFLDFLEDF